MGLNTRIAQSFHWEQSQSTSVPLKRFININFEVENRLKDIQWDEILFDISNCITNVAIQQEICEAEVYLPVHKLQRSWDEWTYFCYLYFNLQIYLFKRLL